MTKKQEDNALTLNFAEANIQDKDTIRLFRDYADRRFLVGYIPEKSKDWVRRNCLYNVRVAAENCKGGVDELSAALPKKSIIPILITNNSAKHNEYYNQLIYNNITLKNLFL